MRDFGTGVPSRKCMSVLHTQKVEEVMTVKMKRSAFWLSIVQIAALKKIANKNGLKMAELARRALDEFIKRESK
jgi:hypothetical protein